MYVPVGPEPIWLTACWSEQAMLFEMMAAAGLGLG